MSKNTAVIGAIWGDEGKGKIVDLLAGDSDCVVRYQGGPNAGHNVKLKSGLEIVLHQIPSGVVHKDVVNYMGNGMVINDDELIAEKESLISKRVEINPENLGISEIATLITPLHILEDCINEISLKIGTTLKGIGPAYKDRIERKAILFSELIELQKNDLEKKLLEKYKQVSELAKLREINPEVFWRWLSADENRRKMLKDFLKNYYCPEKLINFKKVLENKLKTREELQQYSTDVSLQLYYEMLQGKSILFEGSQGTFLDINHGTYPYVTSSNTTIGGVYTGTGIYVPLDNILIVAKAFTTRVGNGPFPTEIKEEEIYDILASDGTEVGATTGRKRRIGWFDCVLAKRSKIINGATSLVLTKLDRLDELDEIKICYAYHHGGLNDPKNQNSLGIYTEPPVIARSLEKYSPVYLSMPGWKTPTRGITDYNDLPREAKDYVRKIEDIVDLPISIIGTGEYREEVIIRD